MNHSITQLIKSMKLFFISNLFLLVIGIFYFLMFGNISITVNTYHPFWPNVFFVNYTFMGDAVFALCLSAFFIFYLKRKNQGMALLYAFLFTEILVQLIQNIGNLNAAHLLIEQGQYLFLTANTSATDHSAIISGHTAIAFAMVTVLISSTNNLGNQILLLCAALLLGYSRIYLAQNYLTDILSGIATGMFSAIIALYFTHQFKGYKYYYKRFNNSNKTAVTRTGNMQPI